MRKKSRITPVSEDSCVLCRLSDNDPDRFGEKVTVKEHNLTVHYFCLLTSSGIFQRGQEDEGVCGFLVEDIRQEVKRSARLTCVCCRLKGAAVGCDVKSCRRTVHFPCGRQHHYLFQFTGLFPSYCPDHSPAQTASPDQSLPEFCSVCLDPLEPVLSHDVLKCPACHASWFHRACVQVGGGYGACHASWFHRACVQHQAQSAGLYFFRCTLCNNQESFQQEMLRMGIYIPERDASWELETNAFEDLLEVYQRCDAESCLCRYGRTHSSKTGWYVVLRCTLCGSQGTHRKCSGLGVDDSSWACLDCTRAVDGTASLVPREGAGVRGGDASPRAGGERRRSLLSKRHLSPPRSPISCRRPSGGSAADLLQALALQLLPPPTSPSSPCSRVEVVGGGALQAGLALVRSPAFDPRLPLHVSFRVDEKTQFPSSPGGDDLTRRCFLQLVLEQMQGCVVFEGPGGCKNLALDSRALREDLYFEVGCLLSVCVVHGGHAPRFLSPALYQCLFNFPRHMPLSHAHLTPHTPLTQRLHTIVHAESLEDLREAASRCQDVLRLAGCDRPISSLQEKEELVEDLVAFSLITRMQLPLQRLREGLHTLRLFEQVQMFPSLFTDLFCAQPVSLSSQPPSICLSPACLSLLQSSPSRQTCWRGIHPLSTPGDPAGE